MPRPLRLPSISFGWYYVALQSIAGKSLVITPADLVTALSLLRKTLREHGARLHAGYIAEREIHWVLQTGEAPLNIVTGGFQHEYARVFNRSHSERGPLFRPHYYALLFEHQRWLVPLVHFVHWMHIAEAPSDRTNEIRWSSDAAYRGGNREDWVTTNVVMRMLTHGAYNRDVQRQAYREMMDRSPDSSHARWFRQGSADDSRLLGDLAFITETWRRTGRRSPGRARRTRRLEGDIPSVVAQVSEQFNALCDTRLPPKHAKAWRRLVTYENLRSRSRKRPLPMVRALSATYLIEHHIATLAQAAQFFGCGPTPVSARRRRFYAALFREWFRAQPDILFSPTPATRSTKPGMRSLTLAAPVARCPGENGSPG